MACDKTGSYVSTRKGNQKSGKLTGLNWSQNWSDTSELRVEVACISGTLNLRHERRRHSLVVHVVPVDVAEEWLAHHLLGISWAASESLVGLTSEQFLEN